MLKALADAMEAGAENGDVCWLALLASWLQALPNLRLGHVIRRSFPVELCKGAHGVPGWLLFFCKRGKQKHNRAGFYWGVPSETASGYDWTKKFLSEYNLRRKSQVGKQMMGMIFRLDTFEYFSARAVNALTMDVVGSIVENPELLTTYTWRRMLPTVALHIKFDSTERVAIGDWKDSKKVSDEALITPRCAEGKAGKTRTCKLIGAAAFTVLDKDNVQSFDDVSAEQWAATAEGARTRVEAKPLGVNAVWHNRDIAESVKGFKSKKSQITFPG